jgi:ubiquinone/menaquinone biosynthesis C-methylase UbiE
MNAKNLGFPPDTFDVALSGFMGWYDCFDFKQNKFTQPDAKAPEIYRVLKDGGRFVCCSWEEQYDLAWMEQAVLRNYPQILQNPEYLAHRPIGMAYEKAAGYETILRSAGFRDIEIFTHQMAFLSTDEEEWWQQMVQVGWWHILKAISDADIQQIKAAVIHDLQPLVRSEGIIFEKRVFFIRGRKRRHHGSG